MKRFFKQFIYGLFFLAILSGIGYLIYGTTLKPLPSCFDGIQNQGELGVDCGGPCVKICTPGLIPPNLFGQAKLFTLPNGLVSALYLLSNQNPDYAVKDFAYEFQILDDSGQVLKTVDGHSFVYAAESKYIAAPGLDIGSSTAATASFVATGTVWARAADFAASSLEIQSSNISESSSTITITGRLINTDTTTFPSVLLLAVLTDNFGDQVGVGQTTVENLAPGETRNFTIIHPVLPDVNLQGTHIFPYALRP